MKFIEHILLYKIVKKIIKHRIKRDRNIVELYFSSKCIEYIEYDFLKKIPELISKIFQKYGYECDLDKIGIETEQKWLITGYIKKIKKVEHRDIYKKYFIELDKIYDEKDNELKNFKSYIDEKIKEDLKIKEKVMVTVDKKMATSISSSEIYKIFKEIEKEYVSSGYKFDCDIKYLFIDRDIINGILFLVKLKKFKNYCYNSYFMNQKIISSSYNNTHGFQNL